MLEKETLSLPDIVDILGPRPFPHKKNILDYLEELRDRMKEEDASKNESTKESETEFDEDAVESHSEDENQEDDKNSKGEDDKTNKKE